MNGDAIPVVQILLTGFDQLELLLGIVDQRAELFLHAFANGITKDFGDLTLDVA